MGALEVGAVERAITTFIVDNFLFGNAADAPSPATSFMETGLIDSTGVLELVGGLLLLLGLFTRPVAFVLSGQMAVAYFIGHAASTPLFPLLNRGEAAVLFCFVFLYLAAAGGGAWALDNKRHSDA